MKMIIKGEYNTLAQFKVIQEFYACLDTCIEQLHKKEFVDSKRELEFTGNTYVLNNHAVKMIENKNTETLTVIIK